MPPLARLHELESSIVNKARTDSVELKGLFDQRMIAAVSSSSEKYKNGSH
jgi:hypothetical protein